MASTWNRSLLAVWAVASIMLVACGDSKPGGSDPGVECASSDECADGLECLEGACVEMDVGVDADATDATDDADDADASDADAGSDVDADADAIGDTGTDTDLGDACVDDEDCEAGFCISTAQGRVCTESCTDDSCPTGWECRTMPGQGSDILSLCVPAVRVVCTPCDADIECGGLADLCLDYADGSFCGRFCASDDDCLDGYSCDQVADGEGGLVGQCVNDAGFCSDCFDPDNDGYGEGDGCLGLDCDQDSIDTYEGAAELCDEVDNDCDESVDEGFDTSVDARHCGACGIVCSTVRATTLCEDGVCAVDTCNAGYYDVDGDYINGCEYACTPNAETAGLEICNGLDDDCDGEEDEDFDLVTDSSNCGRCGFECALSNAAATCESGLCGVAECAGDYLDCNGLAVDGCEIDSLTNRFHCGACDNFCELDNARSTCSAGGCVITECTGTWSDCDGDPSNGCEVNLADDETNCGTCGFDCSVDGGDGVCTEGLCGIRVCEEGLADCDFDRETGCEIDVTTDVNHCGACGNVCEADNASTTCDTGDCAIDACDEGFYDLDGFYENGCEYVCTPNAASGGAELCNGLDDDCDGVADEDFDFATDVTHCGGCGETCALDNAGALCASGNCVVDGCGTGFDDCNRLAADGCEVSLGDDALNCGACGNVCSAPNAAGVCSDGVCGLGACNPGWADCDGDPTNGCEVNIASDESHCGACGDVCAPTGGVGLCADGECLVGSCFDPLNDCDNDAANGCESNALNDPTNCGGCGIDCEVANANGVCSFGVCEIAVCEPGYADCDGIRSTGCEVFLGDDPQHCGACGVDCQVANGSGVCGDGTCGIATCNPGFGDCDGVRENGCEVYTPSSTAHCGACGASCELDNAFPICTASECAIASCTGTFADCDDVDATGCEINVATDVANCGGCGRVCDLPNATEVCVDGGCGVGTCDEGWADCDGLAENGCEVDLNSSTAHCGGCGTVCALANAGEACVDGTCEITTCSAGFDDCDGDDANGCEVNLQSTDAHCGACGYDCTVEVGSETTCSAGTCVLRECTAPLANCDGNIANGCETDTSVEVTDCGACGTVCDVANATETCAAGNCAVDTCDLGYADCDGAYATGCEVDVTSSTQHCGGCGNVCNFPSAVEICVDGGCEIASCQGTTADCDGVMANGCEANLATDETHCGGCGNVCDIANAAAVCVAGGCEIATCLPGWTDCDGDVSNGCETPTGSDVNNCGACGNVCSVAGGTAACVAGLCDVATCTDPLGDCDNVYANGCETNLDTSLASCGACGSRCEPANATGVCTDGSCGIATCTAPYQDCDGSAATGCEINTNTSMTNCGGCGNVCNFPGASESCIAGACVFQGCQTGFIDLDGNTANGCEYECTPTNPLDTPDAGGIDSNCDGYDGDVDETVYVWAGGSDSNSGLTPGAPVATLGRAIVIAAGSATRDTILVATGEYDSDPIFLQGGMEIYGGYAPDFRTRTAVRPQFTTDSPTLVFAQNLTAPVYIDQVIFRTTTAVTAGTGTFTMVVDNSADHLWLHNVNVTAGRGATGTDGTSGSNGAAGFPGNNASGASGGTGGSTGGGRGGNGRSRDAGLPGAAGASNGATGGAAGGTRDGGLDCGDGDPEDGLNGGNGTAAGAGANGANGNGLGTFSGLVWAASGGASGTAGGIGGGGGGGGAGGGEDCTVFGGCVYCGTGRGGGGGGGGGQGGLGGIGGTGGGASVALLIRTSEVLLENVVVTTVGGGAGGRGGVGGAGGGGGAGGSGATSGSNTEGDGGDGGAGGAGGDGGCGGAGGGGPSVGIWGLGSASYAGSNVTFSVGTGGAGGTSCSGGAAAGSRSNTLNVTAL